MALVTVNSRAAIDGHISIPRVGCWHADFMVDGNELLAGPVDIAFADGTTFHATMVRQAIFADYLRFRAVGGNGALYKTLVGAKHWTSSVPISVPLNDILAQAGESLSPTTDNGVLNTQIDSWTCIPQSAPAAIRSLLDGYAEAWRILPDGSFWMGQEAWPTVDNSFGYTLLHQRTDVGVMELAEDTSSLRPGTTFLGVRITRVDNYVKQNGFITTAHYFDAPS